MILLELFPRSYLDDFEHSAEPQLKELRYRLEVLYWESELFAFINDVIFALSVADRVNIISKLEEQLQAIYQLDDRYTQEVKAQPNLKQNLRNTFMLKRRVIFNQMAEIIMSTSGKSH